MSKKKKKCDCKPEIACATMEAGDFSFMGMVSSNGFWAYALVDTRKNKVGKALGGMPPPPPPPPDN